MAYGAGYERYPRIGPVLPAIGYDSAQLQALEATINSADAHLVVVATPLNLAHLIQVNKTVVRALRVRGGGRTPARFPGRQIPGPVGSRPETDALDLS